MKKIRIRLVNVIQIGIVVSIAILLFGLTSSFSRYVSNPISTHQQTIVVIDAGHGDFDPGAVASDGTPEKDINLAIALQLRDIFVANGFPVVMTRSDDTTLAFIGPSESTSRKRSDTQNRAYLANSFNDAVMISIHQNTFSNRAEHGTQLFYGTVNEQSERLAECIRVSVVSNMQPDNSRELKKGTDSIYILKKVTAPIVLVECGFITNSQELESLKDETYQLQMAYSIYLGYCAYQKANS
jgi:N-acetylmuramoyl-L-alanine amidase